MLRESGKNISDRDRKLIRQLKESGPNQRLAKGPGRRMDNQSAKTDSDVRYAAKGGSVSSTRAAFNKAFAAARKKHVEGDGPANFTFKGKRYNVQTKQDRKTTIGKAKARKAGVTGAESRSGRAVKTIRSGRATAERKGTAIGTDKSRKSSLTTKPTTARTLVRSPVKRTGVKRSAPKGMSVEDARSAGLTGAGIRTKRQKVGTGIAKRKADTAAAQKKAAATMKRAEKTVGTGMKVIGVVTVGGSLGRGSAPILIKAAEKSGTKAYLKKKAAASKPKARKSKSLVEKGKDLVATTRGKVERPSVTRQVRRSKKTGRVSEISKATQKTGKAIRSTGKGLLAVGAGTAGYQAAAKAKKTRKERRSKKETWKGHTAVRRAHGGAAFKGTF